MADSLTSGQLYTVDSDGHTAFLSVPCVTAGGRRLSRRPGHARRRVRRVSTTRRPISFPPAGEGEFDQVIALFDCLRANGADIPEVTIGDLLADPTGETLLEQIDPTDPAFVAAALACQDLIGEL